jgi:hypothetical protein
VGESGREKERGEVRVRVLRAPGAPCWSCYPGPVLTGRATCWRVVSVSCGLGGLWAISVRCGGHVGGCMTPCAEWTCAVSCALCCAMCRFALFALCMSTQRSEVHVCLVLRVAPCNYVGAVRSELLFAASAAMCVISREPLACWCAVCCPGADDCVCVVVGCACAPVRPCLVAVLPAPLLCAVSVCSVALCAPLRGCGLVGLSVCHAARPCEVVCRALFVPLMSALRCVAPTVVCMRAQRTVCICVRSATFVCVVRHWCALRRATFFVRRVPCVRRANIYHCALCAVGDCATIVLMGRVPRR